MPDRPYLEAFAVNMVLSNPVTRGTIYDKIHGAETHSGLRLSNHGTTVLPPDRRDRAIVGGTDIIPSLPAPKEQAMPRLRRRTRPPSTAGRELSSGL